MAGYHRRAEGRPMRREARVERRLSALTTNLNAAASDMDRLSAAYDFVRGALRHATPARSKVAVDELVETMRDLGVQALMEPPAKAKRDAA